MVTNPEESIAAPPTPTKDEPVREPSTETSTETMEINTGTTTTHQNVEEKTMSEEINDKISTETTTAPTPPGQQPKADIVTYLEGEYKNRFASTTGDATKTGNNGTSESKRSRSPSPYDGEVMKRKGYNGCYSFFVFYY